MKKSKIYLFGLLAVVFLGALVALSLTITNDTSSSDADELAITKGEKSELAMLKCGDEGEKEEKCGSEEGDKKCGDEKNKEGCDKKKEESKCGEEKCGGGDEEAAEAEEESEE
jgi:hypothetical protein